MIIIIIIINVWQGDIRSRKATQVVERWIVSEVRSLGFARPMGSFFTLSSLQSPPVDRVAWWQGGHACATGIAPR